MFSRGQRVIVHHPEFKGIKGVVVEKQLFYRVKFDYITRGCKTALFKEEELELCEPENIMEYLKHKLLKDI